MVEPSKPAPNKKKALEPKGSNEERLRVVQQDIEGLKDLLKKLRQRLH